VNDLKRLNILTWIVISALLFTPHLILSAGLIGCSSQFAIYSGLKQEKKELNIRKIGVLPFVNESGRKGAAEIVTNTFNTILFKSGSFVVEEKGNIEKFLLNEKVKTINMMNTELIKKLGERLKIDTVIAGAVEEFTGGDRGERLTTPVVAIRARLIDVRSGKILWMTRHRRSGDDYIIVFGFGQIRSASALTKRMVLEMVETIK
jgi:TolB-like protein